VAPPKDVGVLQIQNEPQSISVFVERPLQRANEGVFEPFRKWCEGHDGGLIAAEDKHRQFDRWLDGFTGQFQAQIRNPYVVRSGAAEVFDHDFQHRVERRDVNRFFLLVAVLDHVNRIDQHVGTLGGVDGVSLVRERFVGDSASYRSDNGEQPVGPDRRSTGFFLGGAGALVLGYLIAYRFQLIRNRPDIAFILLVGYVLEFC